MSVSYYKGQLKNEVHIIGIISAIFMVTYIIIFKIWFLWNDNVRIVTTTDK